MSKLVIQRHNFEKAKNELKKFSEQTTTDLDLKRVDDTKSVGEFLGDWFLGRGIGLKRNVTGKELNELTLQIQTHLQSINNTQIKLIKEFGQVYSALEALDNDYIKAILVAIKSTEETSEGIKETQEQIKKIVENQKKTLIELIKFKQKLDGYKHLHDIDNIWNDCQRWYKEINNLTNYIESATEISQENVKQIETVKVTLTSIENNIEDLSKQSIDINERLESVIAFTTSVEKIIHLNDVDEIWNKTENHQLRIKDLEQESKNHKEKLDELVQTNIKIIENINSNVNEINRLKEYNEKLNTISHLEDVDEIWKDVEKHSSELIEGKERDEELSIAIQKNKENVDGKILNIIHTNNANIESLTKKIKYAYWIAGGSAGLAIIELILLLVKVM